MAQGNQPQKRNLAAEAFKRNYAALFDALWQSDLASGLAKKLYSRAIIPLEIKDAAQMPFFSPAQQAGWLLRAVESFIKKDHSQLRKFTRVLRKQPGLEPIAKQLRQCYRELVSEARLTESSSSGSDTDSTEQHQSQGELVSEARLTESSSSGSDTDSTEQHQSQDRGEDPQDDLTSHEVTDTVQSYNQRSSQPAEEGVCSSVTVTVPKTGIKFTSTSPYEEWCCRLKKYDGGSQDLTASGVIVKLNYPPEELHTHLPGLGPLKKYPEEYGSVQTSYILITCHRLIPGMSYLKGWNLDIGLGRSRLKSPYILQSLVCGAMSCCGENGFISSGPNKPTTETAVFFPHPNGRCLLELDFTILFLNAAFEKLIRKGVQAEPPELKLSLRAEKNQRLILYQREPHEVVHVPISLTCSITDPPRDSLLSTLKDEIRVHRTLQVIRYTQSESQLTQCCSGSPLVSCDPNGAETLVGIHVKSNTDSNGSGITIYGIFQLLKGQLAAFFALMEQFHARRIRSFRWVHLPIQTLESDIVGPKEKPLSYLLEILHHLLTKEMGIRIIELHVSESSLKHKSVLEVLSALFKQFDKYGCEEIADAVSGMFTVGKMENQFNKQLQQLSDFLVNLLDYLLHTLNDSEVDLVKAYFVCYNHVLSFRCKGKIQAVLSQDDVTENLKRLGTMYSMLDSEDVIKRNFHNIYLQPMNFSDEFQIHQLEAHNQQLKAQLQKQDESDIRQQLQLTKRTLFPNEEKIDLEEGTLFPKEEKNDLEEDQKRLEEAMKEGYVNASFLKVIFTGAGGVGKTHAICLLRGADPPDPNHRQSTGCINKAVILRVDAANDEKWEEIDLEKRKDIIAEAICAKTKKEQQPAPTQPQPESEPKPEQIAQPEVDPKPKPHQKTQPEVDPKLKPQQNTQPEVDPKSKPPQNTKPEVDPKLKPQQNTQPEVDPKSKPPQNTQPEVDPKLKPQQNTQPEVDPKPPQEMQQEQQSLQSMVSSQPLETELDLIERIHALIMSGKFSGEVLGIKWVYAVDTGGQPPFHELLSAFIKGASVCAFVFKLSESLDHRPLVEYWMDGIQVGESFKHPLSNRQILEQSIQTIRALPSLPDEYSMSPLLFVIGTHRDEQNKCTDEVLEDKEKTLHDIMKQSGCNFQYNPQSGEERIIFDVNAKNPQQKDKDIAATLRRVIADRMPEPEKIPLRHYGLELELEHLANEKGVISMEECRAIGDRLNFDDKGLKAALRFLHKVNALLYYPKVKEVKELIFCDPLVLIKIVSMVVAHIRQIKHQREGATREWKDTCERGLITVQQLNTKEFRSYFRRNIFTPKHIFMLFEHLLIAAMVKEKEQLFFMPCLLDELETTDVENYRPCSNNYYSSPLSFQFRRENKSVYAPSGLFSALVAFLLSLKDQDAKLCSWGFAESDGNLYRNVIKFHSPSPPAYITLINFHTSFEVFAECQSNKQLPKIRTIILKGLTEAKRVRNFEHVDYNEAFTCKCPKAKNKRHLAEINIEEKSWSCSHNPMEGGPLEATELVWYEESPPSQASGGTTVSDDSSDPGEDRQIFGDLTSQEGTMTVQHSREEEYFSQSKTGNRFTGASPYEEWCCRLNKYDGGSQDVTTSGVIVKLNYPPEELHIHLPGLRPMEKYTKEYGSVKTSYILITCHHTIPGLSYMMGWNLTVGLGKFGLTSPLKPLVCGAVSCCGENGLISSGPLKPTNQNAVFSPHPNGHCLLDLDFTILFLNPEFEKLVLNRKRVKTSLPEIVLTLLKVDHEKHQQLQLYQREQQKVVPIPLSVRVQPQDSSLSTLTDEIKVHKTLQVIDYTQSESQLTQCCSGSPLVFCDPYGKETLVGIHIKAGSNCDGYGITIYGIFQLLKGELAAFFALMEQPHARKKWPFRWAHLLTHTLESDVVGVKEKPLSYLLDILHLLLTDKSGICLIEFQVSDPSFKLTSALQLLTVLFKQFDKYECEEIAEAISAMLTDEVMEKLRQLLNFLVNLLDYLLGCNIRDEADLVKAYFVCYNQVLNFEYKGKFPAVLSMPDVTKKLQSLRKECSERLPLDTNYVIGSNFQDIWLQLMKCKYESQIHQLEEQNKQLKAQLQKQDESDTWQELQLTKRTLTPKEEEKIDLEEGTLLPKEEKFDLEKAHLPGMNVIGQTQIAVHDGPAQSFEWRGYGLKLFIPSQSLSSGVGECLISIQAGLSGQFTLPQQYSLVGAVYGITVTTQFAKLVTLEIEHCADCNSPDDCEALTFAIAKTSTQELPYSFEVLPGGVFTPMSSHGSIRVQNFSLLTILAKLRSRKRYCAQLFYVPIQPTDWRLYFVVTKDLEAETKKAAEMYPERKKSHDIKFKVQFGEGQPGIELDILRGGIQVTPEGWNIKPSSPPRIAKEEVDSFRSSIFRSSCSTPSCELHIHWSKDQNPQFLSYEISLKGTKDPDAYFIVSLNPGSDSGSTGGAGGTGGASGHETLSRTHHLDITCYLIGVNTDILQRLGVALGIAHYRLQNIQSPSYADNMVSLWLLRVDQVMERGGPTWATLEKAMRHETVGMVGTANDIKRDRTI